tara:strand:+ start:1497 stop:1733 length:237 start_codon:yes stop_codon:yes gene_type:complete
MAAKVLFLVAKNNFTIMIAKLIYGCIFANLNRGVEQLVARWAHNPKVAGSSPVPATQKKPSICLAFLFYMLLELTTQQ